MYIEIYEILWTEATQVTANCFTSKKFQRVFFNHGEAKECEKKYIKAGLNPELKIHKMPVKKEGERYD